MAKPLKGIDDAGKNEQPRIMKSNVDEIFTLVEKEGNVQIAIGNYLICKKHFKSFKKAEEYLAQKPYEILINVACLMAEQTLKNYETLKKTEKGA